MRPLDRLHVEVEDAIFGANGGVTRVGEGARRAIAESGDVVFVAAEVLTFGSPERTLGKKRSSRKGIDLLELKRTELLVDNLPDNLVGRHCVGLGGTGWVEARKIRLAMLVAA